MIGITTQINLLANKEWDAKINKRGPPAGRSQRLLFPFVLEAAAELECLSFLNHDLILLMIFIYLGAFKIQFLFFSLSFYFQMINKFPC